MSDITAIINAHREAELAHFSLLSAMRAITHARDNGISAELLIVLDRGDEVTREVIENSTRAFDANVCQVDYGDLGFSRNHGVQHCDSRYIAFLDADDLWCSSWLTKSFRLAEKCGDHVICHPQMNLVFGVDQELFPQPDQTSERFSIDSLRCTNFWTALSFARRAIYLECPYHPNRIEEGFGYEDWAWNCDTIHAGYVHRVVPRTTHFLRRKALEESLRIKTNRNFCMRSSSLLFRRKFPESETMPRSQDSMPSSGAAKNESRDDS
jgi:glycosyltransferase involved in cell wall biosynthesis